MPAPSPSLTELPVIFLQLLPLLLLQHLNHANVVVRYQLYHQQSLCSGMILASDHRFQTHSVRSLIQCLSVCLATEGCVSVVHEPDSRLCHLGDSVTWQNCSNMEMVGSVNRKQYDASFQDDASFRDELTCENGGRMENGSCVCTQPYHGDRCEEVFRDCSDTLPYANNTKKQVTTIFPVSSPSPFRAQCYPEYGRTYVFANAQGEESFNRSWQEYVDGFGDLAKDHWLGLEHLYHITDNDNEYRLMFVIELTNKTRLYCPYDIFQLHRSASDYYTFSANSSSKGRQTGDCLGPLEGAPFSTYDNDRDGSAIVNCAQRHGFGWWFQGDHCSPICFPLGKLTTLDVWWSGDDSDGFWSTKYGNVSIAKVYAYLTRN